MINPQPQHIQKREMADMPKIENKYKPIIKTLGHSI